MVYTAHGPFSNGIAPAIDQNVMNDIDNCLTGNLGLAKILLTTGSIARISFFQFTASGTGQTINHNLGATPDYVILMYSGNFGGPPTHPLFYWNTTSTQVSVVGDNTFNVNGLAIKFTP